MLEIRIFYHHGVKTLEQSSWTSGNITSIPPALFLNLSTRFDTSLSSTVDSPLTQMCMYHHESTLPPFRNRCQYETHWLKMYLLRGPVMVSPVDDCLHVLPRWLTGVAYHGLCLSGSWMASSSIPCKILHCSAGTQPCCSCPWCLQRGDHTHVQVQHRAYCQTMLVTSFKHVTEMSIHIFRYSATETSHPSSSQ